MPHMWRSPRSKVQKFKVYYGLALFMYLLGLLSKPMAVTLPFVLLLLDYWPLNRLSDFRFRISDWKEPGRKNGLPWLVREKWPFFVLTGMFCFTTWYSVKLGKKFPTMLVAPTGVRLANIPLAYVRYLCKMIYPHNLAVLYPMPQHLPWWQPAGALMVLVVISWMVVRARAPRDLFFGWFMFLGVLIPTIGIVQVGGQAMADRYMCVPAIGLFAAFVWGIADISRRWGHRTFILSGATAAMLGAFPVLHKQRSGQLLEERHCNVDALSGRGLRKYHRPP